MLETSMSKIKKWLSALLILSMCVPTVACSPKAGDETVVQVYMLDAGYGTNFMQRWKDEFEALEEGITIDFIADSGVTSKLGSEILDEDSEIDLWFAGEINYASLVDWGPNLIAGYDCVFEDLTDFVKGNAYGENVSIESKLTERTKYYNTHNGKYYTLSWASGPSGLVYNADYITEEPKTSAQLIQTVEALYQKSLTDGEKYRPFIWSGGNAGEYWQYLIDAWLAQYMGVSRYDEYITLYKNGEYTYEPLGDAGFEVVYNEVSKIADEKYSVFGSSGGMHTSQQQEFLKGKGAMMPNGDWLENEMKKNDVSQYDYNIKMMKAPVISALGKSLKLGGESATDAQHEEKLVNVIDMIDGGKTDSEIAAATGITAEKAARVREARNVIFDPGVAHRIYMPAFSDAKESAKKFLSFIFSDRGERIFREETGSTLPIKVNMEEPENETVFRKSLRLALDDAVSISPCIYKSKLRYANERALKVNNQVYFQLYSKDRTVAQLVDYADVRAQWDSFLITAGLKK